MASRTPKDWDERYAATDSVWSSEPNQFVTEFAGAPTGTARALDIAAGEGRNALWLVEQGWQVTAIDYSAVAVQRMRELAARRLAAPDRFRAEVGDATQLTDQAAYDLVVFSYLQLPQEQWRQALAAGVQACTPGGRVLIVMHARQNLDRGHGGPQDATVLHDPGHVAADVAQLGVDIEYAQVREREVTTDEGPRIALDTVMVLRRR